MSLLAPPPMEGQDLVLRLAQLVESQRLEAVVLTGCSDAALLAQLATLGPPVTAIDVRPRAVAAARARWRGLSNVRFVQGHPARTLADLRAQLPERTLFVFGGCGLPAPAVRDEIFHVPRGEGAIAVLLDPAAGVAGYADVQDALLRWSPDHTAELLPVGDGGMALVAVCKPRVHVTFLIEKYTHEYGASGISINLDNLVATLDQTGLASWNIVHYDECFHEGRPIPLAAISKPAGADVHVLVATLHYHTRSNPTVALLEQAKSTGSRLVFVWLDKKISRHTPDYYRVADVNVVLDGNDFELPNAWPAFTPKNPIWFCDPGLTRDIDVSLVGEVRYLSQRKAMVERLQDERRVAVQMFRTSAADTQRALTVAEYARLYQRSRISLAMTKDSVRQLKGRVFEILHCGAMLLCDVNHHVSHYLRPGVEYVTWRDYDDLADKARYYLDHEDERQAIARAGHARVTSHYSHTVFWRSLLARCGATAAAFHGGHGGRT